MSTHQVYLQTPVWPCCGHWGLGNTNVQASSHRWTPPPHQRTRWTGWLPQRLRSTELQLSFLYAAACLLFPFQKKQWTIILDKETPLSIPETQNIICILIKHLLGICICDALSLLSVLSRTSQSKKTWTFSIKLINPLVPLYYCWTWLNIELIESIYTIVLS